LPLILGFKYGVIVKYVGDAHGLGRKNNATKRGHEKEGRGRSHFVCVIKRKGEVAT